MYRVSYLRKFTTLALLIAVFVIVPIADAVICGVEVESSRSLHSFDHSPSEQTNLPDFLQDHCEHGHCHHTPSNLSARIPEADHSRRQIPKWPEYRLATSFEPDELMRPPKA